MSNLQDWIYQARMDDPFISMEHLVRRAWEEGARAERSRCVGLLHQTAEQNPQQNKLLRRVAVDVGSPRGGNLDLVT